MNDEPIELLTRALAQIDAILRGQHSGWDQALANLCDELREGIAKPSNGDRYEP